VVTSAGWAKVPDAARYAGVGVRTFRKWMKDGLRYSKAPTGTYLIKIEWINDFLEGFVVDGRENLNQLVDSALDGLV
jgi:hypothetical protein